MLNKPVVEKYFNTLRAVLTELDLFNKPEAIWNMDESGVQLVHKPVQVIAKRGSKNVPGRTATNRDNITVLLCVSAAGKTMPPLFVMKGKTRRCLQAYNTENRIPGAVYTFQSKGWMEEQLGIEWFEQIFLPNCGDHRPQLLILDSHCSHEVLTVLEMAKENNIHILALPPHCTHALQPLDRCIFGPVNKAYNNACSQFTSDNPGKVVDKNVFPELYKQAYYAGVTAGNIKSGFRSCGIHPFNSDAVPDSMMAPSLVTDQPAPPTPPAAPSAPPTPVETSDLEDNDATYAIPEETPAGFIELSLPVSSEQQEI